MKAMILPPDKSYIFNIPKLERTYVRTGVIGDGSCFFHSFLRATNYKYKSMNTFERKNAVRALRNELTAAVDFESFRKISGGEYRKMLFFGALRQLLSQYKCILPTDTLFKVLEQATAYKENFYEKFIEEAFTYDALSDAEYSVRQGFVDDIKFLFIKSNELSMSHLRDQLLCAEIGATEIEFISRHLTYNFVFVYETEEGIKPYPFSTILNEEWPYCVLLWVQESHYEVIGVREPNMVVTRVFYRDDEIVKVYSAENDLTASAP